MLAKVLRAFPASWMLGLTIYTLYSDYEVSITLLLLLEIRKETATPTRDASAEVHVFQRNVILIILS